MVLLNSIKIKIFQEAVSKLQWKDLKTGDFNENENPTSLDDLELGELIAKGCNAVVYSAKLKNRELCYLQILLIFKSFNFSLKEIYKD